MAGYFDFAFRHPAQHWGQYASGQPIAPLPGESNVGYGLNAFAPRLLNVLDRTTQAGPGGTGAWLGGELDKSLHYAFAPATGGPAPAKPPGVTQAKPFSSPTAAPGNSYKDPAWGSVESQAADIAAQKLGNPNLAAQLRPMLASIRTVGERSNNNQISPKGAQTVYQIMPATAQLFQQKYGVAPSTSLGAATVAALHLGESLQRGSDPVREYIGGPDKSKWGPQTQDYGNRVWSNLGAFQQAAGAVGLNQPMPAFDASGYKRADQLLSGAQQAEMKPFSATYQEQPLPQLPAPTPLQAPDYSAGDAAFAKATPKNPFGGTPEEQAAGQLKLRRSDYFSGMAQALGSIDWSHGVGLGELFAKIGAGALMGAKAGDEEVRKRMDKFDGAMQEYQMAVANRDDGKAREQINIANQNVGQLNQYKRDLWTIETKKIEQDQPQVVNGVLVTKTKQLDGTTRETHTPLDPARQTAALFARANNGIAAANAHNEYDWQTYRANREMAGAALPYAMADANAQGNTHGRDGIFAVGLSEASIAATETGQWENLYNRYMPNGSARAAQVKQEAIQSAGVAPGTNPTKEQSDQINSYVSSQLMQDFVNSGKSWVLVGGPTVAPSTGKHYVKPPADEVLTSVANQRGRDQRISRSTNAKGQTSTTVSGPAI